MQHYSIQSFGIKLDLPGLKQCVPAKRHWRVIVGNVALAYGVRVADILSGSRDRSVSWPRQAAYLIVREERGFSYTRIGRMFERDHGTIQYGCRAARDRLLTDEDFAARYEEARAL